MNTTPGKSNKVVRLRLDALRLDAGTQVRAHIDIAVVEEYAEAMLQGDRFPPVVAFQQNGEHVLADGFHRVKAARRAKLSHITAEVRRGSRLDALRYALGANHAHGLRLTNADKRRSVEMALAEFGNLSDHLVGEMCGVSQRFVTNLRHQLSFVLSSTPRLGKDGKLRALPVRRTSGSTRTRVVQDSLSVSEDGEAFQEVAEALADLEAAAERVAEEHPGNRSAVVAAIRKLRTDLLNLEKRIAAG
jgi:ParB-like chromosome segregation protein Spo0J